jgi:hypothetical protein
MRACPSELSLANGISTPIRRICAGCCARKASGQATVEPPTSVMKSRRLTERPLRTDDCSVSHCPALEAMLCGTATSGAKFRLWVISGHGRLPAQCPLYPRKRTSGLNGDMSALGQADSCSKAASFDYLVGAIEQRRGIARRRDVSRKAMCGTCAPLHRIWKSQILGSILTCMAGATPKSSVQGSEEVMSKRSARTSQT